MNRSSSLEGGPGISDNTRRRGSHAGSRSARLTTADQATRLTAGADPPSERLGIWVISHSESQTCRNAECSPSGVGESNSPYSRQVST